MKKNIYYFTFAILALVAISIPLEARDRCHSRSSFHFNLGACFNLTPRCQSVVVAPQPHYQEVIVHQPTHTTVHHYYHNEPVVIRRSLPVGYERVGIAYSRDYYRY